METTLEVRWFGTGSVPEQLWHWFENHHPDPPSTWTDLYLPSEDTSLNVKLRDDKLQVKRRLAGPTPYSFGPNASGGLERWTKWSFTVADETTDLPKIPQREWWLEVEKTRRQRPYDSEAQASLSTALPTSPPATVFLELTTLAAIDTTAWTLCLEAEGPSESLAETLLPAARALLDSTVPLSLSEEQSFGYMQWMQQLSGVPTCSEVDVPRPPID